MRTLLPILSILACLALPVRAESPLIVHEWGTFTSLQDENGQAIGGINVDDEPVPPFVFQDSGGQEVAAQYSRDLGNFGLPPYAAGKGWAPGDPAVTMRLETPVIYFYPPKGQPPQSVPPLDVHVDFHGGFLTQFYPYADAVPFNGQGEITEKSSSSLNWDGVRMGSTEKPVETNDKVWTTPREVSAPLLEVMMHFKGGNGQIEPPKLQAEHFLFYRGVGHVDPPLYLARPDTKPFPTLTNEAGIYIYPQRLRRGANLESTDAFVKAEDDLAETVYDQVWMVKILPNGACAFDTLSKVDCKSLDTHFPAYPIILIHSSFADTHCTAANLTKLKISMREALVKEGLYPDEASAMLRTWELSYFKSPGLRFFYIVPRPWVDKVLPLTITGAPTEITRVMIGRIELITNAQKAALARLATGPCPDLATVKKAAQDALQNSKLPKAEMEAFYRGEKPLSELGIAIPPQVQDYLSLGRFRDALVVHEQQSHPSPMLAQFIRDNHLVSGN